jgi:hypothetical protein
MDLVLFLQNSDKTIWDNRVGVSLGRSALLLADPVWLMESLVMGKAEVDAGNLEPGNNKPCEDSTQVTLYVGMAKA